MNILNKISLYNFRNHEEFLVDLNKSTTLIVGENGSGKTSVLEAIYLCLQGKSFRAVDDDILQRGKDFYRIELDFLDGQKEKIMFNGTEKKILQNGTESKRIPKKNKYPVVLFLPEDLHLIQSSPTRRRDYFNRFFNQMDERYHDSLLKYNKALKQRNELLKRENIKKEDIFSWDVMLAKYGNEILRARAEWIKKINKEFTEVYRKIAKNKDEIEIFYTGEIIDNNQYIKTLENNLEKDKILGYTSFGVHRDDFIFKFNDSEADGSASRGEIRSMILALKFIEADLLYKELNKRPVILLDDVFSELDKTRQKSLVKNFKDNQVILTSVEEVEI